MADKQALGQILQSQQANGDAGSFEEYRNRKGKVLPGYNPVNPYEAASRDARYLQEQSSMTASMEEQVETPQEEKTLEERSLENPDEVREEQMAADVAYDEEVPESELTPEERERRRRERVILMESELEERHKALEKKIDAALAAEKQRAKDLYAIENKKKNTMDYANKVYGDEADLDYIVNSARGARDKATERAQDMSRQLSEKVDGVLHQRDTVTVLMPDGTTRVMDRDVAEAMRLYTDKSHSSVLEQAAAGLAGVEVVDRTQGGFDRYQDKYEEFQLTRNEEEKLAELQRRMAENDKQAKKFEEKAPETMSQQEYNAYNRERRLKEFGDPSASLTYDYVVTKEGVYEWNGRPLPSAMSSPTLQRELQKDDKEMTGPSV